MQFSYDMEKEEKSQRVNKDFWLQWGNRKRLRCVRVRDPQIISQRSDLFRRKITSPEDLPLLQSNHRLTRNSEAAILRSSAAENQKSGSPEKEDRYYTTRASVVGVDDNGKVSLDANCGESNNNNNSNKNSNNNKRHVVWPKLYVSLSSKEKEEDFMAMKGCKLPQRPKRRAKIIQRSLLLVSPGAWLSDMCQERYEVREKRSSKKRPRGLKAMGSMESDSD